MIYKTLLVLLVFLFVSCSLDTNFDKVENVKAENKKDNDPYYNGDSPEDTSNPDYDDEENCSIDKPDMYISGPSRIKKGKRLFFKLKGDDYRKVDRRSIKWYIKRKGKTIKRDKKTFKFELKGLKKRGTYQVKVSYKFKGSSRRNYIRKYFKVK